MCSTCQTTKLGPSCCQRHRGILWPSSASRLEKGGLMWVSGSLLGHLLSDPVVWADLPLTGLCFLFSPEEL